MNQPTPEEQLRRLLDETVGDIEPHARLAAIRYRTQENAMPTSRRPWIWGALGAAAATAAVIGGVAVLAGGDNDAGPGPSTSPSATVTTPTDSPSESPGSSPSESPSESPSSSPSESPSHAVPVYYVGDTPRGLRLYREFQVPTEAGDPVTQAADLSVRGGATDPDYRSLWPAGTSVATSSYDGDVLTVNVESADASSGSLHDRPAGMTRAEAELAIQQVIYTAQAALGEGRPGVQFMLDGERTDQLLGVPTSEPLAEGDWMDTLALVSLSNPTEGQSVTGKLQVSGVASSFEATVPWQLLDGSKLVKAGSFMADGWIDKLYPFEGTVDLAGVAPGTYTFVASTDDPSGGAEGNGPDRDTRTVVVE